MQHHGQLPGRGAALVGDVGEQLADPQGQLLRLLGGHPRAQCQAELRRGSVVVLDRAAKAG